MKEQLKILAEKIKTLKDKIKSEEATKQSMVLPLLHILGYDIFNPEEVMPEVHCDIANKGDKIDYVITNNGKHEILIECKECHQNLDNHISQLRKYFVASDARFAILTNGIQYLFFSDHDKNNIMDEKPFYSLNMNDLSEDDMSFLSGFRKGYFNSNLMLSLSQDIIFQESILNKLKQEFLNPSKGFVRLITSNIYDGKLHDSIYTKFSKIIKDRLKLLITEDLFEDDMVSGNVLVEDNSELYTLEEQNIKCIVKGWLKDHETEDHHIHTRKLSSGYISFDYNSKWWPICRIKIRPKFENKICVKICKNAIASNCSEIYLKDIENLSEARKEIETQCADTKDRFFKYKAGH